MEKLQNIFLFWEGFFFGFLFNASFPYPYPTPTHPQPKRLFNSSRSVTIVCISSRPSTSFSM